MRGAEVIVRRDSEVGRDAHGNATVQQSTERVQNVLCMPGVSKDAVELVRPFGVEVAATLGFPKTYNEPLRGCSIYVPAWRQWFEVVGDPMPVPHNCPTRWNYKVWVKRSDG
jgi:hypothetical protein